MAISIQILIYAFGGLIALWATFGLGELVLHQILQRAVNANLKLLEAIDRNTPTGATGIIGFILMFIGFSGQIIGTILSASPS